MALPFRQQYEVEIKIGADTLDDLIHSLENIAFDFERKRTDNVAPEKYDIVSGSPSAGYVVKGDRDPEWTPERHKKALMEWHESRRDHGQQSRTDNHG